MEGVSRIFSLTTRAKVTIILVIAGLFFGLSALIAILFMRNASPEIIAAFTGALASLGPAALLSLLVLFSEKNEKIDLIEAQSDVFLASTIPALIRGRYIGEPFDTNNRPVSLKLNVDVFHDARSPHAGYRVSSAGKAMSFTLLLNVYRLTLMFPVYIEQGPELDRSVSEHCDQLLAIGFKLSSWALAGPHTGGHLTMVALRKEFLEANKDFIFSRREQFFVAREIGEFCRTIIRSLAYSGDFPVSSEYPLQEEG